jgi:hypothetical protein
MQPRERRDRGQIFRARLDQIVDTNDPLATLGRTVAWGFLGSFGAVYSDGPGQPPLPSRLIAGIAILKCKSLDLIRLTSPDEIPACHSSHGAEIAERIDSVKDARFARAGAAGAAHPSQERARLADSADREMSEEI